MIIDSDLITKVFDATNEDELEGDDEEISQESQDGDEICSVRLIYCLSFDKLGIYCLVAVTLTII